MNFADRLRKLRQNFTEREIDAIFISQPDSRRYLSGFDGSAGYLLITTREAVLATDFRYLEQAQKQAPDYEIFEISSNIVDWFPKLVSGVSLKRLGFEAGHITFACYRQLSDILSKAPLQLKLVPMDGLVESLRMIKGPEEIELISQAAAISDAAFEYIEGMIHPGMSEQAVAWEIEKFMRERGSQAVPFDIIVASGPNSALPHARPSSRPINSGEPIIIDLGARIGGYSSDLTRTLCLGLDRKFSAVYDTVLGAQLTAIAIIREGMTSAEADRMARIVIEEAGYGKAFGHALGHGIGLSPHERPRLGPNSDEQLTDGMMFTIEPGIYFSGWGGVRIEDLVLMESGKVRVISKSRKVGI
jgi:Xaa-Pro aminopeptidase